MAEVLFEIPEWLDYADYDNYPTQANPTTNADFVNYMTNQNKLVGALTGVFLWQPNTNFIAGKIIITPNMPEGMEAVALTGGFTGTVEPAWESDTSEYQDSGVKWKLRFRNWGKTEEEARNTLDINLKTYTTFEQLGFTSKPTVIDLVEALPAYSQFVRFIPSSEVSAVNVPDSGILTVTKGQYTDYASLWFQRYGGSNIAKRAYYANWGRGQTNPLWKELAFKENNVVPLEQGGTGGNTFVKSASISGRKITLDMSDDTTITLTTQDTGDTHYVPNYSATVSVTFPTSSTKYTAPSNGIYFCCFNKDTITTTQLYINGTARLKRGLHMNIREDQTIMTIPLCKGDVIYWDISPTITYTSCFVPYKSV